MKTLFQMQIEYVHQILEFCNWNRIESSAILGISERTVRTYIRKIEKEILFKKIVDIQHTEDEDFFIFPTNKYRIYYLDDISNRNIL